MVNITHSMCPVLRNFITGTLSEEQQEWINHDLDEHPEKLMEFLFTEDGHKAFQVFTENYMKYSNGGELPTINKKKEIYKRNSIGLFQRIKVIKE